MIIKGSSVSVRCTKYIWTLEVVSYRFYNHYTCYTETACSSLNSNLLHGEQQKKHEKFKSDAK